MKQTIALAFSLLAAPSAAFPFFRERIPNGFTVPNPGPQGGIWAGVGHLATGGGGPRNPFGIDFRDAGFQWTVALCQKDSDGDGRSNGVELGDPDCVWIEGEEPAMPASSHPGIVDEPISNEVPDPCETYNPPPDTVSMDIKFTQPNQLTGDVRTQYICEQKTFNSPITGTSVFHQLKSEVIDNNPSVLHHIWIYACDDIDSSDGNMVGQGAYGCDGVEANCQIIAGWALGGSAYCEPDNVGVYVDFGNTPKVFKIEAHYDNAMLQAESDQSGMRIHLTPTLRPLDGNLVILGMDYWDREFVIPGGTESFSLTNICPTTATSRLNQPIYVYAWNAHMHYYGRSLVTEHYRCGVKIGEIGRIDQYEFDNQQSYFFETPIKVLPGDALVTTCTFDTTTVLPGPVLGGEETTDEMCDNYLSYYPFVGSFVNPTLFTYCSSYNQGLNPAFVDFDDRTPFVTLDLAGDVLVFSYDTDPAQNVAACCSANDNGASCEALYLATNGEACAENSDCLNNFCDEGLCKQPSLATSAPSVPPTPLPTLQPTPLPTSPPTTAPTRRESKFCFSSVNTVDVHDATDPVDMKDVKVGDLVRTADGLFEPVYGFGHRQTNERAEFLRIYVDSMKAPLELSAEHMVFVNERHSVPASALVPGDSILLGSGESSTIERIESSVSNGVYAPFTPSGTIVVNGVLASTYVAFQDSPYLKIGGMETFIEWQWLAHSFEAPHRMFCRLAWDICVEERVDGISSWVAGPLAVTEWILRQHWVVAGIFSIIAVGLMSVLWLTEALLVSNGLPTIALVIGVTITCRFLRVGRIKV